MSIPNTSQQKIELVTTYLDNVTIIHQEINHTIEGLAIAIFSDYVICYKHKNGIKEGPATKKFNDGSYIKFNYIQDRAQGPAIKVFANGDSIHFFYRNDIAEETD